MRFLSELNGVGAVALQPKHHSKVHVRAKTFRFRLNRLGSCDKYGEVRLNVLLADSEDVVSED